MKIYARLFLLLMVSTGLITSCKKPIAKQTRYIPKDAVFVASINTKSLGEKLVKNQLTIENIIRNISGSDTTINKGRQEFEELKSSGIDLDDNFYVAVVNKGGGMSAASGPVITSAIGTLKDEAKLQAYLKKKDPSIEIRKEQDYSFTTIGNDKLVAWAKDVVIMLSGQRSFSMQDMNYDSTTGSFNLSKPGNALNDLKAEIASDFKLTEDQSAASIPEFRDLMQDKSDANMWVNSSASMQNLPLPLPKLKELFSNSFTAAKVDFDNGKISVNSKSYYSQELRDIIKKYSGPTADISLVEYYPSDNINGFGIFSFNPDIINGLVKYLELGGIVDGYLTKMMGTNYTLEQALKAIKGDFAVVVSDFATRTSTDTSTTRKTASLPDLKMIVNIPVGDKVEMNRLMDRLVKLEMVVKTGNEYRLTPNLQRIGYQLLVDDKNLFITSDQNVLNQYKARSKKAKLNKEVLDDFKSRSGVAYINIESILNGIGNTGNEVAGKILPKAKETFKDLEFYTDNFKGDFAEGHMEVHFRNEKENSLTSLLSFFETASQNIHKGSAIPGVNNRALQDSANGDENAGEPGKTK